MSWYEERFTENERRVRIECMACSRLMWLPQSKAPKYTTCGGECRKRYDTERVLARERACAHCGRSFIPRPAQIADGAGKHCSHRCAFDGGVHARLFEAAIQEKALVNRLASVAINGTRHGRGAQSASWRGGREASRERHREANNARTRAYRKAHPEWCREQRHKRANIKTERLPRGTVKRIGELQRWKCAVCHFDLRKGYHVDHIQALARGGLHLPANIQLLCPPCNVRKSAKDPLNFMQERGYLL